MIADETADLARDDLHPVWQQIVEALDLSGCAVFPAVPDITTASVSWPGVAVEDWLQFVEVAKKAGAAVLYAEASGLPPAPSPGIRAVSASVAEHFPERLGMVGEIELAFAVDGVVHYWSATADWWDEVTEALGSPEDAGFGSDARAARWVDWRTPTGEARIEEVIGTETVAAAVERVARNPRFQQARSRYEVRNAVVDEPDSDPEIREWCDWPDEDPQAAVRRAAVDLVLHRASERAAQLRDEKVRAAIADLGSLRPLLQQFPGWAEARLADEKRRRIREFVLQHLGFHSPDLNDRLYTAMKNPPRADTGLTLL